VIATTPTEESIREHSSKKKVDKQRDRLAPQKVKLCRLPKWAWLVAASSVCPSATSKGHITVKMAGVRNAFLFTSHIAFAVAFAPTSPQRLPSTFSGAAPNLRSLPALGDLPVLNRAGNAPAALSGLTMEHSHVSRRQLCVWGAGIASALVSVPARANENTPTTAHDIVPATLTVESGAAAAEKIRAAEATRRTAALRVQAAGGPTRWTLIRESFLG
jgi:hypothetical protein